MKMSIKNSPDKSHGQISAAARHALPKVLVGPPLDGVPPLLLELVVEGERGQPLPQGPGDLGHRASRSPHHAAEHTPHTDRQALGKLTRALDRALDTFLFIILHFKLGLF